MRSIILASLALITACSPSTPHAASAPPSQTAVPSTLESSPCATGFVEIVTDKPACGIALEADGSLSVNGRPTRTIVASYQDGAEGRVAIPARQVILFPPSPRHGFRIVQACEAAEVNSLCWAVRWLDPDSATLQEIAAGKYGPSRWIRWSPAQRRVALISQNEGAEWLHVVDTATGATTTYPAAAANADWQIDRESFVWTGDDAFAVKVKSCGTCAPETRSFTLP